MKTVVIQSYRTENVPPWIARCMESARAWAAGQGFDYRFADDSSFALCGDDYLARVGRNMRSITNLSRLELVRQAHNEGYDRAIWLDADILVFHPAMFTIGVTARYAFAGETWVDPAKNGSWRATSGANNSVFVCMRGEPDLDFLIAATRHIALNRPIESNYQVGGDLIKGLRSSLRYATLDNVGMFSKHVVRALAEDDQVVIAIQGIRHGTPVFAANLCAADHYTAGPSANEVGKAIDVLLATRGDIVNRWLPASPKNLRDGKPHVGMARLFSARENIALLFHQQHGREFDFDAPSTFNERIAARKHLLTDPIYRETADKVAVRGYVAARLGEQALVPQLQVCVSEDDLDFAALPDAFILKAAHASGWNHIVRDKRQTNAEELRALIRLWLASGYETVSFEAQYKDIPRRILVEQLLLTADGRSPDDYRFYVFNGRVGLVGVNAWRPEGLCGSLFDTAWRRLDVTYTRPSAGDISRPPCLEEMIAAAEKLGKDFPFLRVDLYWHENRILFGEMTHTPNGGGGKFDPPEFDAALGRLWGNGEAIPQHFYVGSPKPMRPGMTTPPSGTRTPAMPRQRPAPLRQLEARYKLNPQLMQFNALSNFKLEVPLFVGQPSNTVAGHATIELGSADEQQAELISCLMVTQDRLAQSQLSIAAYRRQTWRNRELILLDTSRSDALVRWVAGLNDPSIRVFYLPGVTDPLGALRNQTIDHAHGDYVTQWDDDDLSHPARLEAQMGALKATDSDLNLLCRELMWMPWRSRIGILQYRSHENTLLCRRDVMPRYPELKMREDTPLVQELVNERKASYLDMPELYLYAVHGTNTWDDEHMEKTWELATYVFPDYTATLNQLSRTFAIREYQQILSAQAGSAAGS